VDEGHAADELDFDWNMDVLVGRDHDDDEQQLFDKDSSSDDDASPVETKHVAAEHYRSAALGRQRGSVPHQQCALAG
jgi:hypothetical protein